MNSVISQTRLRYHVEWGGGGWESRIYFYMQYDQNYTENPCTKEKKITKYIKILKYVCLGDGETAYSICSILCFLTFRISVHDFYNICLFMCF